MAQIVINEISQNYTYNIGNSSFATVALPITACWGPGWSTADAAAFSDKNDYLETVSWRRYPATQAGLEAFVADYRGPVSGFKLMKDYSYQMAMTLLTAGYDVLVCRITPGSSSSRYMVIPNANGIGYQEDFVLEVKGKYTGTFGNNLLLRLNRVCYGNDSTGGTPHLYDYFNLIVYVVDSSGLRTAVENIIFKLEDNDTDIPLLEEVESSFVNITKLAATPELITKATTKDASIGDLDEFASSGSSTPGEPITVRRLTGGLDLVDASTSSQTEPARTLDLIDKAIQLATTRYTALGQEQIVYPAYLKNACKYNTGTEQIPEWKPKISFNDALRLYNRELIFNQCIDVYPILNDKLAYNPQRIISPGWDDQDYSQFENYGVETTWSDAAKLSPLHIILLQAAYYSRCATSLIDLPISLPRSKVYNESNSTPGYAQMLSRYVPATVADGTASNGSIFSTHSAVFGPWGQYTYVGMSKQCMASPSFLALMIQRAMLLNQALQYEWALPTTRRQNLRIGKMAYTVSKKYLDEWQKLEGVGVNVITNVPDLGTSLWGNSTLYEVPPATYQALANLSTRYLVNAVENVVYKCGIAITFRYNNAEAYSSFYAGVTPLLDTMKNVGAIDDYYVRMAADINGLDQVNANTVVGKIYLVINGVINDIIVDLIALPPGTDLDQYRS